MNKFKLIIQIASLVIFVSVIYYLNDKGNKHDYSYQFKGKVENVEYDVRGISTVTINDTAYYLGYINWNFEHNIQKGDSMIKLKNTMAIKLIKKNTHEIIIKK